MGHREAGMICPPCREAADIITRYHDAPLYVTDLHIYTEHAHCVGKAKGATHCDCQHRGAHRVREER